MQVVDDLVDLLASLPLQIWVAAAVLAAGVVLGIATGRLVERLLDRFGVPSLVEGTSFERTAGDFGTSTVSIVGALAAYFVLGIAVLAALSVVQFGYADRFWNEVTGFLPQLFVATLVLVVGMLVGDKVELAIDERLSGVKLPQVGVVAPLAKYSVVFVAALVALAQLGVAVLALVVVFGAYVFAVVVLSAVAFHRLLASAAAGIYLLLSEPYGIGDEVEIADHRGVVQEVDLLVTHIEADGEVYVVPNATVFAAGVVKYR